MGSRGTEPATTPDGACCGFGWVAGGKKADAGGGDGDDGQRYDRPPPTPIVAHIMNESFPGKTAILIGIPVLLFVMRLLGFGGNGFLVLALLLVLAGSGLLAWPLRPSRHRLLRAAAYFFAIAIPLFLFS